MRLSISDDFRHCQLLGSIPAPGPPFGSNRCRHMNLYIYAHLYANLRGCGYSGAGKSIYTYMLHIYTPCMLISGAAATRALAFTCTHIHITRYICMLNSGAATTRVLASPYTYICVHFDNAILGGCGYLGAGKSIYIYLYTYSFCSSRGLRLLGRWLAYKHMSVYIP